MIDVGVEELVLLSRAARIVNPANPPNVCTLWRWARRGVRGERLESILVGGTRYTSREAISRFLARLNEPGATPQPPNRRHEAANAELARVGFSE